MQKLRVTAVITDLDNTLFDWVAIWYAGFKPLLDGVAAESGLPIDLLEREFKQVYECHGTSEYAFAIQELPSLVAAYPGEDLPKKFANVIHASRKGRKQATRLYPDVLATLRGIKARGCLVIGYTESMAFYTHRRVKQLGLDGALEFLYSPPDHVLPVDRETIRSLPADAYRLYHTEHRHTPEGELKPNPALLLDIIEQAGARAAETLYVGDGLVKDISMAQAAQVIDVYAKYGDARHRDDYQLLRRVSHWRPEMIERDREVREEDVRPSFTLTRGFAELRDLVEFDRPRRTARDPHLSLALESWKQAIEVQQHFNDLELRIRNFAITILLASLGAAGVAVKEHMSVSALIVPGWALVAVGAVATLGLSFLTRRVPLRRCIRGLAVVAGAAAGYVRNVPTFSFSATLPSLLLLGGLAGWGCCYFMDRFWYHRLLVGAVKQGQFIEHQLRDVLPEIGLTEAIGRASPLYAGRWSGKPIFELHSDQKVDLLYWVVIVLLAFGAYTLSVAPLTAPAATAPTTTAPKP